METSLIYKTKKTKRMRSDFDDRFRPEKSDFHSPENSSQKTPKKSRQSTSISKNWNSLYMDVKQSKNKIKIKKEAKNKFNKISDTIDLSLNNYQYNQSEKKNKSKALVASSSISKHKSIGDVLNKKVKFVKNKQVGKSSTSTNRNIQDKLVGFKKLANTLERKKKGKNAHEANKVKFKKRARKNKTNCTDNAMDNQSEGESEDDAEIRKELENSSIYKNIQKLLKENPSLCSGLSEDENLSSMEDENLPLLEDEATFNSDDSESEQSNDRVPASSFSQSSEVVANNSLKSKEAIYGREDLEVYRREGTLLRDRKPETWTAPSALRNKSREKLQAAKFRFLNEKLYTENGKDSFIYFQSNKDEFEDYHQGYSLQVSKWPMNPVNKIISSLQSLQKSLVVADMGCGDAKIAHCLTNCLVHSFDLVALNECVTPCNISKVPLSNETVDVVVFCLSLMGTNLKEYLQEAYRITKIGGFLKIAEVESRIPSLDQFIGGIQSLGYSLKNKNVEHKLFVFLDFVKTKKKKKSVKVQDIVLKPCLYKKR